MGKHGSTNLLKIIIATAVIAVIYFFIGSLRVTMLKQPTTGDTNQLTTLNFRNDRPLIGFPSTTELAMPASGVIVQSYLTTIAPGQIEATRVLESSKSVEEIFDFYTKFLIKKNGWTVSSETNDFSQADSQSITAQNAKGTLNINISRVSTKTIIELGFIAQPSK